MNHWDNNYRKSMNNSKSLRKLAKSQDKSFTIQKWSQYTDHVTTRIVNVIKECKKNKSDVDMTKNKLHQAAQHLAPTGLFDKSFFRKICFDVTFYTKRQLVSFIFYAIS